MGRAKVNTLTAKENVDPLLSKAGDLVTKHMEKARHSLPFLPWFFGCKIWLPRFLSLLAKFVWQWNDTHSGGRLREHLKFKGSMLLWGHCYFWKVMSSMGSFWWLEKENARASSEGAKGRFWGHQAHHSNLSPMESYRAYPHGSNFQAHEGQEGDWEQPAWIYRAQIMPDQPLLLSTMRDNCLCGQRENYECCFTLL